MKPWLEKNDIEMYSAHNEGKSIVAERFIRTLKNKIYKYMTSISKNVYIDKLDDIVNEYNNTKHRTTQMKPIDVKDNTYIDFVKEVNDDDPKFKVGDHARISKYKNVLAKGVPDEIKNKNVKIFNLFSRTNETRHIKWHRTCKCKCRLDVSICNNKQRWNDKKCRCEYKELIGKGMCEKEFIWNPRV